MSTNTDGDVEKHEAETQHDDGVIEDRSWLVDEANPYNWSLRKKWCITVLICFLGLGSSTGSSIYTQSARALAKDQNASDTVAVLPLSLYVLGWGGGPLLFGPLSEEYGRNVVYRITWTALTLSHLASALAPNIASLIIFRFIGGLASGAVLAILTGSMTDLWTKEEIAPAMGLCAVAAYMGPALGPIVGGYLSQTTSWRWDFWFMLIFCATLMPFLFFCPETFNEVAKRRARLSEERQLKFTMQVLKRPIKLLCLEPVVFFMSLYLSFVVATLNFYFCAYPVVFQKIHGFTSGQGGLAFLGLMVGVFFGAALGKPWNKLYLKLSKAHGGDIYPEARLPFSIGAAICLPGCIFWFAWTGRQDIHYIVPILSGVPFGCCVFIIVLGIMSYLADAFRQYTASAIAALTVFRSLLSAAFPLFCPDLYENVDTPWATSILGFVSIAMMPIPYIFYQFGPALRAKSKYK